MQKGKLQNSLAKLKYESPLIDHLLDFLKQPPITQRHVDEDILIAEFKDYLKTKGENPENLLSKEFLENGSEAALFFDQFVHADQIGIQVTEQKASPYTETFLAATQTHVLLGNPDHNNRVWQLGIENGPGSGEFITICSYDIPSSVQPIINCITPRRDGSFLYTNDGYSEEILKIECKSADPKKLPDNVSYKTHVPKIPVPEGYKTAYVQDIASLSNDKTVAALGTHAGPSSLEGSLALGTHIAIFSADGSKQLKMWEPAVSTVAVTSDDRIVSGSGYVTSYLLGLGQNYWTGTISVWNQEGKLLKRWDAPTQCLAIADNFIFSYGTVGSEESKQGLVSIWELESGERLKCFPVPRIDVRNKFDRILDSQITAIRVRGNLFFVASSEYEKVYTWFDRPAQKSALLRKFFFSNNLLAAGPVAILESYLGGEAANPQGLLKATP